MRAVSLEGKSIDEYLCKIKGYVNELTGVGVPVHHEYVDMILEGLSFDYTLMISVIESKKHTLSIAEIETLLYGHETHIVCYNKETQALSSPFLNYTQGYSHPNSYKSGDSGGSRGAYGRGSGGRGGFLDRGAGRSGGAFAEVEVVADLPIFSVKSALSMTTLQMFVTSGLIRVFSLMNRLLSLIQPHFHLFPTPLILPKPLILGLVPIPSLLFQHQINQCYAYQFLLSWKWSS